MSVAATVAVVAVVAVGATVLAFQRTYEPFVRTLLPAMQDPTGSEYIDHEAGIAFPVPQGWRVEPGDLVFGRTALVVDDAGLDGEYVDPGSGSLVLIGELTPGLFAATDQNNQRAAASLASGMGEFFVPVSGERVERRVEKLTSRAGTVPVFVPGGPGR